MVPVCSTPAAVCVLAAALAPAAAGAVRAGSPGAVIRIDQAHVPPVLGAGGDFSFLMWLERSAAGPAPLGLLEVAGTFRVFVDPGDQSIRAVLVGSPRELEIAIALRDGAGAVPLGEWILIGVSFDTASGTLGGWARSESVATVQASAEVAGFTPAPPAGDLLIGRPDGAGTAQAGLYGLMVLRDHAIGAQDFEDLWSGRDYLGPWRMDNSASGGRFAGPDGVAWMVNHAMSTHPGGGVIPVRTAALVGGDVATTNFCVLGPGPGAGDGFLDAGAVEAVSAGADAFIYESPFDATGAAFFVRPAINIAIAGPPAAVAATAPLIRDLARDEPAGVRRVVVSGNSRAVSPGDADDQTLPEHFAHGLIAERLASTLGVLNRRASTVGNQRWFGYDATDPPRSGGTIRQVDTTTDPERAFSYLWTNSTNVSGLGPGTGLYLHEGAFISMKCRPEAGSLMDGGAGDGTTADFPLTVRAYVLRFPGAGSVSARPEKSGGQAVPGTPGPAALENLDTTVLVHALSAAGGDVIEPATPGVTLGGDHTASIGAGDACFVAQGAGAGAITVVESVALLEGPRTGIVFEKWFPASIALDSSELRFGPWSVHAVEHTWPALAAGDPEIFRGLELAAAGGPVAVFAFDAWRPDVSGWAIGGYGTGGMGYTPQIQTGFSRTHHRAIAALEPDVWLQVIAQQNSQPTAMDDFLGIVRKSAPGAEAAWLGDAAHSGLSSPWHQHIIDTAGSQGIPAVSVIEEPDLGAVEDQAADALRKDLSHYSHRGNRRLASLWLARLAEAALPLGDLDGDGTVDIADLLALLGAWGPCPPEGPCPADLDSDGIVGVTDLLALLGGWS